ETFDKKKNQLIHNLAIASAHVHRLVKEHIKDGISMGMIVASPAYPKSSHPEDVLVANKANEAYNYSLLDILVNGKYPNSQVKKMQLEGTHPMIEDGDMELLKENKIKNIGLSYYASFMVGREDSDLEPVRNTLS